MLMMNSVPCQRLWPPHEIYFHKRDVTQRTAYPVCRMFAYHMSTPTAGCEGAAAGLELNPELERGRAPAGAVPFWSCASADDAGREPGRDADADAGAATKGADVIDGDIIVVVEVAGCWEVAALRYRA